MKNLRGLTYEEMLEELTARGQKPYRAGQVYGWVYKKAAPDIDSMTDISKDLREELKKGFCINGGQVADIFEAPDGTKKFVTELEDSARIESVIIPEAKRLTLCVSTQSGCALGCRFCMTGKSGFIRNLTLSELVGQVMDAQKILGEEKKLTNIVLMGMGEPFANYDNVVKFVNILVDHRAFGFSNRKVTVSTSGIVPAIKKFGQDANVSLAVSLNAATDEVRAKLMPINKKYPLEELIEALRKYPQQGKRTITIEYVLIKDVNDSLSDAKALTRLLRGIDCKINLIPFNPFTGSGFERPDQKRVLAFGKVLTDADYTVVIRSSKGAEIQAACGQLAGVREPKKD